LSLWGFARTEHQPPRGWLTGALRRGPEPPAEQEQDVESMSKIIGIDLGTTNSCVAVMDGKTPKVIVVRP